MIYILYIKWKKLFRCVHNKFFGLQPIECIIVESFYQVVQQYFTGREKILFCWNFSYETFYLFIPLSSYEFLALVVHFMCLNSVYNVNAVYWYEVCGLGSHTRVIKYFQVTEWCTYIHIYIYMCTYRHHKSSRRKIVWQSFYGLALTPAVRF